MKTGYSGAPLLKKLGIKEDMRVRLIGITEDYLELLEREISSQLVHKNELPDFIHLFVKKYKEFESVMKKITANMKPTTIIWVSWYKKSAAIATDITEDVIRNYALLNNLVDIKVCAVNEIESGLKLVAPLAKR